MDMSSFPKMLQLKRKILLHPQLLRWSNWFSQWSFQVKHIKGKDNLITDYRSRKPLDLSTIIIPPPLCVYPITDPSSSIGSSLANPDDILNMIENLPSKIKDQIKTLTLEARAKRIIKTLQNYKSPIYRPQSFLLIFFTVSCPFKITRVLFIDLRACR